MTNIDGQAVPTQCDPYSLYTEKRARGGNSTAEIIIKPYEENEMR
jgi:hypothetical protein